MEVMTVPNSEKSDTGVASAEFREVAEGRLTDNRVVYPFAPFLEGAALRRYMHYKRRYPQIRRLENERTNGDPELPSRYELTEHCQTLVAAHGSPIASRAVQNGNLALLNWLTGVTRKEVDASAIQRFSQMQHHLRRDGYLAVYVGATDGGKTNSAFVQAEIHLRDNPDAAFATNVSSLVDNNGWKDSELNQRTHYVESTNDVRELAEDHEDLIVVLDEMSTQANAQTSNYDVNEHFYELITFKSKLDLRMIIIGHRESGFDIAPAIREHATHFVRQVREVSDLGDDEFRAEFYGGLDVDQGEFKDHKFDLSPVPEVSAWYDPDDQAVFHLAE